MLSSPYQGRGKNDQVVTKFWKNEVKRRELAQYFQKTKVKRIGVFQKFLKTKQNEVNSFKILQDRSKTNIFVSNCEEGEKRKKTKLRFF